MGLKEIDRYRDFYGYRTGHTTPLNDKETIQYAFQDGVDLRTIDLTGASLPGIQLRGVDLRRVPLRERDSLILTNDDRYYLSLGTEYYPNREILQATARIIAKLRGAKLNGSDLREADLSDANLHGADLRNSNLEGAILRGADLSRAQLDGANMKGTDSTEAKFTAASLESADLSNSILAGTDFLNANLKMAKLRHTNLSGAFFLQAEMDGVDVTGAYRIAKDKEGKTIIDIALTRSDLWGQPSLSYFQTGSVAPAVPEALIPHRTSGSSKPGDSGSDPV